MKVIKNVLAILLLISSFVFAQTNEMKPEVGKFYNAGNKLLKAGDYTGAIEKYNNALQTSKDYRIFYQKAISLKKLRKYKLAEEAFQSSIQNNPKFDLAYNGLGGIYFVQGKYSQAVKSFTKFKEVTTKKKYKRKADQYISKSYTKLGAKAKSNGRLKKAVEYLKKAVSSSDYDAAYLLLAEVSSDLGNYKATLSAAEKALKYRKSISKGGPFYYKGLAYKGLNEKDLAVKAFRSGKKDRKYKKLCEYELKQLRS